MSEQKDFFSPNHKQLLGIATWAKYLAPVVLVIYVLAAGARILPYQVRVETADQFSTGLVGFFMNNPFDGFNFLIGIFATVLNGIVYYLVLKGTSLGLNMIVETDINYREQKQEAGGL